MSQADYLNGYDRARMDAVLVVKNYESTFRNELDAGAEQAAKRISNSLLRLRAPSPLPVSEISPNADNKPANRVVGD